MLPEFLGNVSDFFAFLDLEAEFSKFYHSKRLNFSLNFRPSTVLHRAMQIIPFLWLDFLLGAPKQTPYFDELSKKIVINAGDGPESSSVYVGRGLYHIPPR